MSSTIMSTKSGSHALSESRSHQNAGPNSSQKIASRTTNPIIPSPISDYGPRRDLATPYGGATKRPRLVGLLAGRPLMARVASPTRRRCQAAGVPTRSRIGREGTCRLASSAGPAKIIVVDHVGPVGLHRPPRPCDAQDPGGGRSEPVLRGDTVRGAAVRAGWGRPPRRVAGACCAREATSWAPASSSSCSWMMLSRSKLARLLWPVRSMATRSGTLARMRLRAAVRRQSWRKRVGTPAA